MLGTQNFGIEKLFHIAEFNCRLHLLGISLYINTQTLRYDWKFYSQFVQSAQEFLLPKLKQKYWLWFCCDGGIFNKRADDTKNRESITSLHDDLNIQELPSDDRRINQVSAFEDSLR